MIAAAVALLALVPPPVSIFYSPDFPERTTIAMRDQPIRKCAAPDCGYIGHWQLDGLCPLHSRETDPRPTGGR